MKRRSLVLLAAGATLGAAAAAQTYPTKTVTLVVPYAAGGASDALARALGQRLGAALKQQVIIDNKAGGNTVIGASAAAKAAPDGYTLLLTAEATLTMNPHLYAKLPYKVEKNFAPVAALAGVPQSFVVAATAAPTLQQFIATAKAQPDKFNYATLGTGSTAHLNMVLFQKAAGVKMSDVSYKGASPALTDLMGGHVNAMIVSTGLVAPLVTSGKVKALAVAGTKRSPLLPDVPTFAEAGLPGFTPASWFALLAPAGTPADVIAKLNAEVNTILADPAFRAEHLDKHGLEAIGGPPEQLAALIRNDTARMATVIKDANIRLE